MLNPGDINYVRPEVIAKLRRGMATIDHGRETGKGTMVCVSCRTFVHNDLGDMRSHLEQCLKSPIDALSRMAELFEKPTHYDNNGNPIIEEQNESSCELPLGKNGLV